MHGHKSPRADIVIWETATMKAKNNTPVLVIECKSEAIDINIKDYYQGERKRSYKDRRALQHSLEASCCSRTRRGQNLFALSECGYPAGTLAAFSIRHGVNRSVQALDLPQHSRLSGTACGPHVTGQTLRCLHVVSMRHECT